MKQYKHVCILLFFSYSLFSMETSSEIQKRKAQEQQEVQISPKKEKKNKKQGDLSIQMGGRKDLESSENPVLVMASAPALISTPRNGLPTSRKIAPADLQEVKKLVTARSFRVSQSPKKVTPTFTPDQFEHVERKQPVRKKTYTHDQVTQMIEEKKRRLSLITYTEDEVADILQHIGNFDHPLQPQLTSRMRELGEKYQVPLEQLPVYAELLHGIEISPRLVADFVYQKYGQACEPHETIVEAYEKVAQKKPDKFQEVIFAMMQAFVEEVENVHGGGPSHIPSAVAHLHTDVLERRIEDQGVTIEKQTHKIVNRDDTIYKARMVIVVKFIVIVGFLAWALYGQINSNIHSTTPATNGTLR